MTSVTRFRIAAPTEAMSLLDFKFPAPTVQTCFFCGVKYVGLRVYCTDTLCEEMWRLKIKEREYHNPYGPLNSGPRKTLLVDDPIPAEED